MPDPPPYRDTPWDHNGECTFCDELAMHRADCPWLLRLIEELKQLQAENAALQKELDRWTGHEDRHEKQP